MPADAASVWQPGPITARIYPGTRFVQEGDDAFLRLGVELLDDLEDPVKGVGLLRIQLLDSPRDTAGSGLRGGQAGDIAPSPQGVHLYGWDIRLATRAEQVQYWSPVSGCYLMDLQLDGFEIASRPCRVRVELDTPDGRALVAEAEMQTLP